MQRKISVCSVMVLSISLQWNLNRHFYFSFSSSLAFPCLHHLLAYIQSFMLMMRKCIHLGKNIPKNDS